MITTRPRFADATLCPDCRAPLPEQPFRCPSCALPLHGFLARELFTTLASADDLLERLRASAVPTPAAAPTPPPPPPAPTPPARRGLGGASVASLLLGLGALCLLVAAVIFLAVAWSWLGVGGRTAVLVGLTAATGAGAVALGRRGLRVAAEALVSVSLGLLVLDIVGADNAGWFGDLRLQVLARMVGAALFAAAIGFTFLVPRTVVPQLVAPVGLAVVLTTIDWDAVSAADFHLAGTVSVLAFAALAAFALRTDSVPMAWFSGALGGLVWFGAASVALIEASEHATVRGLWLDGHGYELIAVALLALLPLLVTTNPVVRQGCAAVTAVLATYAGVLPGLDGSDNQVLLIAIGLTLAWATAAALTPPHWSWTPRVPLAISGSVVVFGLLALAAEAVSTLASVGPAFSTGAAVRLTPAPTDLHPVLLLAATATLAFASGVALPRPSWWREALGAALGVAAVATLCLFPTPLWLVLLAIAASAGVLLVLALPDPGEAGALRAAGAAGLVGVVILAASPSAVLTTAALAAALVATGLTLVRGRFPLASEAAGAVLPLVIAGFLWSAAEVAEVDLAWRAAPILVVLGLLSIVLTRVEVEVASAAAVLVAALAAIPSAADVSVSTAIHLTVSGALVTASAIIHRDRRLLAWPGGLLLALATWVRLADIGVEQPEPYTLPAATALVLVGLFRMRTSPEMPSTHALLPGLTLATVPSLLWVLVDPISLRAVVLGAACLLLLLGGAALRWNAPVIAGAAVGCLVVLREVTPYALQAPQWALIGLAGSLLITVGITWESRMSDAKHATAYLARLR